MNSTKSPLMLGVGGTTRPESKSERTLRGALAVTQRARAMMQILAGATLKFAALRASQPRARLGGVGVG
jgi:hypothetical protein